MANSTAVMNAAFLIFLAIAMVAPQGGAITCGEAVKALIPCLNYLKNGGPVPPVCCNGVRSLSNAAKTTSARQQACVCLKQAAQAYGIDDRFAKSLPDKCGVSISIKISNTVDCSRVH